MLSSLRSLLRVRLCSTQAGDENRHDLVALATEHLDTGSAIRADPLGLVGDRPESEFVDQVTVELERPLARSFVLSHGNDELQTTIPSAIKNQELKTKNEDEEQTQE